MTQYTPPDFGEADDASSGKLAWKDHAKNAVAVAISLVFIYLALGVAADLAATWLPERWEAKLGRLAPGVPAANSPERKSFDRANGVLQKLIGAREQRPLPYQLIILNEEQPNAFAFPGGAIGVTTGLLDTVKSEPGLALVLGHELGHHFHRHTLRMMGRVLLLDIGTALVFSGARSGAVDASSRLLTMTFSRHQETEADEFGLSLVSAALGTTEGALEFFELMSKKEGALRQWTAWASTHPLSADRIEHLKALSATLDPKKSLPQK